MKEIGTYYFRRFPHMNKSIWLFDITSGVDGKSAGFYVLMGK